MTDGSNFPDEGAVRPGRPTPKPPHSVGAEEGIPGASAWVSDVSREGGAGKVCPYCRADIPVEAKKCRHCAEWVLGDTQTEKPTEGTGEPAETQGIGLKLVSVFAGVGVGLVVIGAYLRSDPNFWRSQETQGALCVAIGAGLLTAALLLVVPVFIHGRGRNRPRE